MISSMASMTVFMTLSPNFYFQGRPLVCTAVLYIWLPSQYLLLLSPRPLKLNTSKLLVFPWRLLLLQHSLVPWIHHRFPISSFFFFWPHWVACRVLVPRPGIEPVPPALGVWSLNHWIAREFPPFPHFMLIPESHSWYLPSSLIFHIHLVPSSVGVPPHYFWMSSSLLSPSTTPALVQATIFSHLCCCNGRLSNSLHPLLLPPSAVSSVIF